MVQGRAWDVAVDIRENSSTFGEWVGLELTGDNHKQFWIPAGFAHGFIALEDNTQFYIRPRITTLRNVKEVLYGMIQILRLIGLLKKGLN